MQFEQRVACSRRSDSRAVRRFFFVNFSPELYYLNAWNRLNSVILKYPRSFFGWEMSIIIIKTKKTFRLGYDVERIRLRV